MTDSVIQKDCDACDAKTLHARDQRGESDPPRVVTDYVCSECGTTTTQTQKVHE